MLDYYASHGPITDPGPERAAFDGLPSLTRIVQGLVFHYFADAHIVGWTPPKTRMPEIDSRTVRAMLRQLRALDDRPLGEPRPPERRILGCCRDFTVLLCAMARHHGIPVRARVGFATYFSPGFYTDHEVLEWWDARAARWKLLDPELSARHVAHFKIGFDTFDVPREAFLVGGRAWQRCRSGTADPDTFGLDPRAPEPRGMRELLLWDIWG